MSYRLMARCSLIRGFSSFTGLTSEQFMRSPCNEPTLEYRSGSQERRALDAELDSLYASPVEVPICVGDERRFGNQHQRRTQIMPFEHARHVASFNHASEEDIEDAIDLGMGERPRWEAMPLGKRADIFLHAADLCAGKYRMRLNAATMLGQAKNIQQAELDSACELVDFLRFNAYFALQLEKNQPLSIAGCRNSTLLRGLGGFVGAIAPFNMTSICANLATAPALMGNVVLWKPSDSALLSNFVAFQALDEAGLPPGVIAFVPADGLRFVEAICENSQLAGVNFTGTVPNFRSLFKRVANNLHNYTTFPRLVGECSGKDFHFVHSSAHIPTVLACTIRAAFENQGQKCTACSRLYVPKSLWPSIERGLVEMAAQIKMGDVRDASVFMSALIDAKAFRRVKGYIDYAKGQGAEKDGARLVFGGDSDDSRGYFVAPTCIQVDSPGSILLKEEIFGPVLTVYAYPDAETDLVLHSLKEATPYGLCGAVFAQDKKFLRNARAVLRDAVGNLYLNDKCTGSMVGQQPLGGARLSGTNDKAGGPYYLLRWTSPQTVKETFAPQTDWKYPHMN